MSKSVGSQIRTDFRNYPLEPNQQEASASGISQQEVNSDTADNLLGGFNPRIPQVAAEPSHHAGICDEHGQYCLFWCISCLEWICRDCTIVSHPHKTCHITSIRQALREMQQKEDRSIKNTVEVFDENLLNFRHKCQSIKHVRNKHRQQIKELQTIISKHKHAERILEKENAVLQSAMSDGLGICFMLLESQSHLLEAQSLNEMLASRRSAQECQSAILSWYNPILLKDSKDLLYSRELQRSTSAGLAKMKESMAGSGHCLVPTQDRSIPTSTAVQAIMAQLNSQTFNDSKLEEFSSEDKEEEDKGDALALNQLQGQAKDSEDKDSGHRIPKTIRRKIKVKRIGASLGKAGHIILKVGTKTGDNGKGIGGETNAKETGKEGMNQDDENEDGKDQVVVSQVASKTHLVHTQKKIQVFTHSTNTTEETTEETAEETAKQDNIVEADAVEEHNLSEGVEEIRAITKEVVSNAGILSSESCQYGAEKDCKLVEGTKRDVKVYEQDIAKGLSLSKDPNETQSVLAAGKENNEGNEKQKEREKSEEQTYLVQNIEGTGMQEPSENTDKKKQDESEDINSSTKEVECQEKTNSDFTALESKETNTVVSVAESQETEGEDIPDKRETTSPEEPSSSSTQAVVEEIRKTVAPEGSVEPVADSETDLKLHICKNQ